MYIYDNKKSTRETFLELNLKKIEIRKNLSYAKFRNVST